MASQAHFSRMPSINIPRTKMKMPYKVSTSFQHGRLVPLDAIPVIPGDTFKVKLSSLIRMSNPIRPIMGDIQCDIHAFFVPMRLVYDHTEEFFGQNNENAGPQTQVFKIPHAKWVTQSNSSLKKAQELSVGAYLGKPAMGLYDVSKPYLSTKEVKLSVLKEKAVLLCWNEWYRAAQVEDPYIFEDKYTGANEDDPIIASRNGDYVYFNRIELPHVNKKFDYFTSATMSPQFGEAVEIALGEDAPVELDASKFGFPDDFEEFTGPTFVNLSNGESSLAEDVGSTGVNVQNFYAQPSGVKYVGIGNLTDTDSPIDDEGSYYGYDPKGTLVAKLNQATMVNVNELRYAFALQKWLERSNFTAGRYFELLQAHYGVTSPDSRLQRPEHLGSTSFRINVSQVLSTAGSASDSTTKVGEPGANSLTLDVSNLFTKGFVEFGFVVILLDTKHDRSYGQGVLREDSYEDRFDYYSPEFANIGDQAILNKELFVSPLTDADDSGAAINATAFGYQEHWAEMRYRPNRVTGLLNPAVSSSLNFWTLADNYSNLPELSEDFLFEDRDSIARCLVTGENGPDYIADFYFDVTAVRPMPAYTIPGLIDHFGAL